MRRGIYVVITSYSIHYTKLYERGKLFVFRANTENPIPIETDENMKYKTIVKATLQHFGILWFVFPPIYLLSSLIQIPRFIAKGIDGTDLIMIISWVMMYYLIIFHLFSRNNFV